MICRECGFGGIRRTVHICGMHIVSPSSPAHSVSGPSVPLILADHSLLMMGGESSVQCPCAEVPYPPDLRKLPIIEPDNA